MTYQDQTPHSQAKRRAQWLALAGLWLLVSLGVLLVADEFARNQALRAAGSEAATDAELKIALLNVALERPRAIPLVLSGDPDLAAALDGGGAPALDRLNRKLEGLIEGTQSSVIYVTGPTGLTIASSNWRQADSFVGSNYAFREYFQAAMKTGMSEHYALGNVSHAAGSLYLPPHRFRRRAAAWRRHRQGRVQPAGDRLEHRRQAGLCGRQKRRRADDQRAGMALQDGRAD